MSLRMLDPDRLLPPDPGVRGLARALYDRTRTLPIVSPHGHVDAALLADDRPIGDPAAELVTGDHYLLRMLYSQGIPLESLGARPHDDGAGVADSRDTWLTFASHYHLFRGTPSKLWLDHTLSEVFGVAEPLSAGNAGAVYDHLVARLAGDDFRPRALYERFGIELLATTDGALDDLDAHARIRASGWSGRVVPTFRPDDVVDPDRPSFGADLDRLAKVTGEDTTTWAGYLEALRTRRAAFVAAGATASDHGHPTAVTADLPRAEAEVLFRRVRTGEAEPADAERFRGQVLVEMAAMSLDDGLVLQLHAGSWRGHNPSLAARFGADKGADIPKPMDYVGALKPLLDRFGNEPTLTVVVYTLDESTYSRELAPLAGHYPGAATRAAVVVPRQPRGHPPVPATRHRDGGLRQHGRLQRRRPVAAVDPRPPRHGPQSRRRLPCRPRGRRPPARRRGRGGRRRPRLRPRPAGLQGRCLMPVVLVGLMGAGKSTVGRLIADATGRELVDVDVAITTRTGKTVRELWEEGGEAAYRSLESGEVLDALRRDDVVIAAPGGVVLDPEVRQALKAARVVWLRTSPSTLGTRVRAGDHRPLLGDDPEAELAAMAADRAALYASVADVIVDTDGRSAEAVAADVLDHLPA